MEYQADHPSYDRKELISEATLIAEGLALSREYTVVMPRHVGKTPEENPLLGLPDSERQEAVEQDGGVVATLVKFRIDHVYKGGGKAGQEVHVLQTGGVVDGVTYRLRTEPPLDVGKSYLLFTGDSTDGASTILGGIAGAFLSSGGDRFVAVDPEPAPFDELTRRELTDLIPK